MSKHFLPMVLAGVDVVEALVCLYHRDWPRTLYWLSAAALTYSTVMMKG